MIMEIEIFVAAVFIGFTFAGIVLALVLILESCFRMRDGD